MTRIGFVTTSPGAFTSADPDRDCAPLVAVDDCFMVNGTTWNMRT